MFKLGQVATLSPSSSQIISYTSTEHIDWSATTLKQTGGFNVYTYPSFYQCKPILELYTVFIPTTKEPKKHNVDFWMLN